MIGLALSKAPNRVGVSLHPQNGMGINYNLLVTIFSAHCFSEEIKMYFLLKKLQDAITSKYGQNEYNSQK
jgi:hypothetical protein